jgi:hypothetical protein
MKHIAGFAILRECGNVVSNYEEKPVATVGSPLSAGQSGPDARLQGFSGKSLEEPG